MTTKEPELYSKEGIKAIVNGMIVNTTYALQRGVIDDVFVIAVIGSIRQMYAVAQELADEETLNKLLSLEKLVTPATSIN